MEDAVSEILVWPGSRSRRANVEYIALYNLVGNKVKEVSPTTAPPRVQHLRLGCGGLRGRPVCTAASVPSGSMAVGVDCVVCFSPPLGIVVHCRTRYGPLLSILLVSAEHGTA